LILFFCIYYTDFHDYFKNNPWNLW
jgi:hypothetical protein